MSPGRTAEDKLTAIKIQRVPKRFCSSPGEWPITYTKLKTPKLKTQRKIRDAQPVEPPVALPQNQESELEPLHTQPSRHAF